MKTNLNGHYVSKQGKVVLIFFFCMAFFTLISFKQDNDLQLFVSPSGSDLNKGTLSAPLKTIDKAREMVKSLKTQNTYTKITIFLRAGVYQLDKPLMFTADDSGTDACPVTYSAYNNEQAVISGGKLLPAKWQLVNAANNTWRNTVPAVNGNINQLFANGARLNQSSSPLLYTAGPIKSYSNEINATVKNSFVNSQKLKARDLLPFCSFSYNGDDLNYLDQTDLSDIEVMLFQSWDCSWHKVSSINKANSEVYLKSPAHFPVGLFSNKNRYYVKNSVKDLKKPGDWCYSKKNHQFWYVAKANQNPNTLRFTVPYLNQLMVIGSADGNGNLVKNIKFTGITFNYSGSPRGFNLDRKFADQQNDKDVPGFDINSGYTGNQAAYDCGQAIKIEYAQKIDFSHCEFAHLGAYAINADKYSGTITVTDSKFNDLGGGGIVMGYYETGSVGAGVPPSSADNLIADCQIHDIGIIHPSAVGIGFMNVNNSTINKNEIYNTGYSGISIGWVWGFGKSYTYANKVTDNDVHDVMRLLADGGGIYTLGRQGNTIIKGNKIHNITRSADAVGSFNNGMFFDEGSSELNVDSNTIFNIQNQKIRFNKTDSTKMQWRHNQTR